MKSIFESQLGLNFGIVGDTALKLVCWHLNFSLSCVTLSKFLFSFLFFGTYHFEIIVAS